MRRSAATRRWLPAGLAIASLAAGLAACGSDGSSVSTGAQTAATAPTTTASGETVTVAVDPADDPCALVSDAERTEIFSSEAPDRRSTLLGGGFGECEWESGDVYLSVAVVPAANFKTDFVDQLNVTGPVESAALGEHAVSFPGVVGIGRGSSGGVSVGFSTEDTGVIVAVKTGEDGHPARDLALATRVAESIAAGL